MIDWMSIVLEIYGLLKGAYSLIKSSSSTTKRLLQPTYDISRIREKISNQSLGIGSRVKVQGRYSEFIPFVDMSTLLLSYLADELHDLQPMQAKETQLCIQGGGVPLIHTCRLGQIDDFWPAVLFSPQETKTSSRLALPIFFDNSTPDLLKASTGDTVELNAQISPLPSKLVDFLHPDPIFIWKRKDQTPIPIGLRVEKVRRIAQNNNQMLVDIWLLGHFEPFPRKPTMCPFLRTYANYRITVDNTLHRCPIRLTTCGAIEKTSPARENAPPIMAMSDIGRRHIEGCFFFENLGGRFFRIGKGHIDVQSISFERNKLILLAPLVRSFEILKNHYRIGNLSRSLGRKRLKIDFTFDQLIPPVSELSLVKNVVNKVINCQAHTEDND